MQHTLRQPPARCTRTGAAPLRQLSSNICSRPPPLRPRGSAPLQCSSAVAQQLANGRSGGTTSTSSSSATTATQQAVAAPLRAFDSVESAVADIAAGKFVIVLDDEDRENEGDLIMAADKMTQEAMHFLVEHSSGVVCIAMHGADLERLELPLMVNSEKNNEAMYTAFTITVDLDRDGVTTGISAHDRTATVRAMANPAAYGPRDFRRPGHIFPLIYHPGGVLVRPGHTEASVDLATAAGCFPAGVISEMVNHADGSMARTPLCLEFAAEHGLKCITIEALKRYRREREQGDQQR